ncbi:DEAD/DEAH box helicase [Micromonospora tulbaghiae]|uniref:DEAD/DEAH box helicase n=1 Tax=Micromonospora tulbaghiae TaxID=479978 RepID=UPI0033202913
MPARTHGKFKYLEEGTRGRPEFVVAAAPHVMMKLKRNFPRAWQDPRRGYLMLTATTEVARDLEWFCERHPLAPVDAESLAQLNKMAAEHRNTEEQVARILGGAVVDHGHRAPAVEPRDYQKLVPEMLRAQGYLLLGDDVGLGKTLASSLILTDPAALPALIVAPTHLVKQWAYEELPKYYPWLRVHVIKQGTPYDTSLVRKRPGPRPDVLVTNYHKLVGWGDHLAGEVATVIFDEGHELRTGPGTGKYVAASLIAQEARYKIACTATPVYNYADEVYNVVSILDPEVLGTNDEFTREWGGKKIPNPRALGAYLRESGIMLRRTRKEVGRELPPVSSMIQPVETDHQRLEHLLQQGIVAMAAKVLDDATGQEERFTLSGQLDIKLRHATGVAKAPYVAQFVKMLLESEEKILLVGHHHDVYEQWRVLLADYNPVFYTGRQSDNQKREAKNQFIHGDSRVLIMAVRSGAGLNGLQEVCSTVVFGELDWSPAQHHQVIGRLARDGQQGPVAAFYMLSDDGADPPMAEILDLKRRIADPINDPDAEVVQPSSAVAMDRVKALAADLLRRRGVDLRRPPLPKPQPGGPLISRQALQERLRRE